MSKINFQNLPNTTTPVNATNLNSIQEKNIITVYLPNQCNCSVLSVYTKVTGFSELNKIGTRLSLSNDTIVIGAGVSKIKVSGKIGWYADTGSIKYGRIIKNDTSLAWSTINIPNGAYGEDTFPEILVNVQQGDVISMLYYTEYANDVIQNIMRTYMTVEVVE